MASANAGWTVDGTSLARVQQIQSELARGLNGSLYNQRLFNPMIAGIYSGQEAFMNHPITRGAINTMFFIATGGIEGIASLGGGIVRLASSGAKISSRAFFSGAGTEARAIGQGYKTLGQTRAGQNLMKLTADMPYYPGSRAYNMWARLSTTYAKGIPEGSVVNVFLNNPSATGIWNAVEKPILQQRGVTIINHIVK